MSQITASIIGIVPGGPVETLTTNVGGAVGPTAGNINVVGGTGINGVGTPGTSTITLNLTGAVADSFPTDAGTATPVANALTVHGGELLNTTGAGSTVTVDLDRGTNGQLIIAATGAPSAYASLTSTGGTITYTAGPNTLNLESGSSVPIHFPTDAGTANPSLGNLTIHGTHNINTTGAGSIVTVQNNNTATFGDLSVVLAGSPSMTLTSGDLTLSGTGAGAGANINLPDTSSADIGNIKLNSLRYFHNYNGASVASNLFVGENAGNYTNAGSTGDSRNVGIGENSLLSLTTGIHNTCVGSSAGKNITTGIQNVAVGLDALGKTSVAVTGEGNVAVGMQSMIDVTSGSHNVSVGHLAMNKATTGSFNVAIGGGNDTLPLNQGPLFRLLTGVNNIAIGGATGTDATGPGFNYTGAESSNICLGSATTGTTGESNVMRLGTSGASVGQVNKTFIGGVDGVNVGSVAKVLTMASDQVGTATITAGANVTITPSANVITIAANSAGQTVMYRGVNHAASPYTADTLSPDYYLSADVTAGIITIKLPDAPSTGRVFIVKDKVGLAAASNITVTTVTGTDNIDGATSYVLNTAYQSAEFIWNGASYEIF